MPQTQPHVPASVDGTVEAVVRRVIPHCPDVLGPFTDLQEIPGFTSTTLVQLLADVEEATGMEFDDDDIDLSVLTTFGPLCALVRRRLADREG